MADTEGDQSLVKEEIEGLGDSFDVEIADYPLDDIMVRSETRTVSDVVKRIDRGRFFMAPDFQRDFVWEAARQSKLIESCIMRIPLPVLYVAEGNDGRIVIVDGLQRLTTFVRFLNDELVLTGLGNNHPLNSKRFSQLPISLQERVEDTQLTLYILDKNAPQRARLDIFERVNSGSILTRQQMRNAIYNGPGTLWLHDMALNETFLRSTGRSLNAKTMRDREAINRFGAFHVLGWESYEGGDMDEFLAKGIEHLNKKTPEWLSQLECRFIQAMHISQMLFGIHAFRKSLAKEGDQRSVINISLFDVLSSSFSTIPVHVAEELRDDISQSIVCLVKDETFENSITYSTNSTKQVRMRFQMAEDGLAEFQELEFLR